MKFKELDLKPEGSRFSRLIKSKQARRSLTAIGIGALAGFLYFYFTEGKSYDIITTTDVLKSMFIGGFFGFFITNSPCARGRC